MQDPDLHRRLSPEVRKTFLRSAGCLTISASATAAAIAWGLPAVGPDQIGPGLLLGTTAVGLINLAADFRAARTLGVGRLGIRSRLRRVGMFCTYVGLAAGIVALAFGAVGTIWPSRPGWMSVAVALAGVSFNLQVAATQIRPLLPANQRELFL